MKTDIEDEKTIRVIKTARTEKAINSAVKDGYQPLVEAVKPNPEIITKFAIFQHRKTGKIYQTGDYRDLPNSDDWDMVIPFTDYYPYNWRSPFAAYLVPSDIIEGEIVLLEDLIEDRIGATWNQGSAYRLKQCKALWTGSNFQLLFDETRDQDYFTG